MRSHGLLVSIGSSIGHVPCLCSFPTQLLQCKLHYYKMKNTARIKTHSRQGFLFSYSSSSGFTIEVISHIDEFYKFSVSIVYATVYMVYLTSLLCYITEKNLDKLKLCIRGNSHSVVGLFSLFWFVLVGFLVFGFCSVVKGIYLLCFSWNLSVLKFLKIPCLTKGIRKFKGKYLQQYDVQHH